MEVAQVYAFPQYFYSKKKGKKGRKSVFVRKRYSNFLAELGILIQFNHISINTSNAKTFFRITSKYVYIH